MAAHLTAAATAALSLLAATSTIACPVYREPELTTARQADAIIAGYVTKDVRETSPDTKASIERWLANNPDASRDDRREVRNWSDRARLTVTIDQTIAGTVPSPVTVYWYQMTNNGPPDRITGGYVFALQKESTSTSGDGGDVYAVMQGICSGALVFRRGSSRANTIREMFGLWPEPLEVPRKTLAELVEAPPIPWLTLMVYGFLGTGAAAIWLVALWPRKPRP